MNTARNPAKGEKIIHHCRKALFPVQGLILILILTVFFGTPRAPGAQNLTSAPVPAPQDAVPAPAVDLPSPGTGAGLFFDLFPVFEYSNRTPAPPGYTPTGEDFSRYSLIPASASAGFSFARSWFSALMIIELDQDIGAFVSGSSWSNLPLSPDRSKIMYGHHYPQAGYAQILTPGLLVSAGRRNLDIGLGKHGLLVSSGNPYYDHALARAETGLYINPRIKGSFGYLFTAIGVQRLEPLVQKRLFLHALYARLGNFGIYMGEYNLVTGDSLDFQDVGPFLVYHHLFKQKSNVMFEIGFQYHIPDRFRLYGEFLLDDWRAKSEDGKGTPNSIAFMGGLEFKIPAPARHLRAAFFREDYGLDLLAPLTDSRSMHEALTSSSGSSPGGLTFRLESSFASTYIYRRISTKPDEVFSNRYYLLSNISGAVIIQPFFSAPLAPDTWLSTASIEFASGRVELEAALTYRLSGSQSAQPTYTLTPYPESWFGPSEPVTRRIEVSAGLRFAPGPSTILVASGGISLGPDSPLWSLSAGAGFRLGVGALPSR